MDVYYKWQIFDLLKPNFASCVVTYNMDDVTMTVKKRIIKFLKQGYCSVYGGSSGRLYDALTKEFGVPAAKVINAKNRPMYVNTSIQDNEALYNALVEFSTTDCVAHLLTLSNNPPKNAWETTAESFRRYYLQDADHQVKKESGRFFSGLSLNVHENKKEKLVGDIFAKHILTEEYNRKAEEVIKFLKTPKAQITFSYTS